MFGFHCWAGVLTGNRVSASCPGAQPSALCFTKGFSVGLGLALSQEVICTFSKCSRWTGDSKKNRECSGLKGSLWLPALDGLTCLRHGTAGDLSLAMSSGRRMANWRHLLIPSHLGQKGVSHGNVTCQLSETVFRKWAFTTSSLPSYVSNQARDPECQIS
jgi:hypothetical protein